MSGTRVQIDYFFKDKTPEQVNKEHPELFLAIHEAKTEVSKINDGSVNEEKTVKATYHICHHDEPGNTVSCKDTEQEI